jgi:hypothetical protein
MMSAVDDRCGRLDLVMHLSLVFGIGLALLCLVSQA